MYWCDEEAYHNTRTRHAWINSPGIQQRARFHGGSGFLHRGSGVSWRQFLRRIQHHVDPALPSGTTFFVRTILTKNPPQYGKIHASIGKKHPRPVHSALQGSQDNCFGPSFDPFTGASKKCNASSPRIGQMRYCMMQLMFTGGSRNIYMIYRACCLVGSSLYLHTDPAQLGYCTIFWYISCITWICTLLQIPYRMSQRQI